MRCTLARQLEELVGPARPAGAMGQRHEIGAAPVSQRCQRRLVQATSLASQELILDRVSHQRVAKHELVRTILDDEAPLDECAEMADELRFGHVRDRREHVERRTPPEHRLDDHR